MNFPLLDAINQTRRAILATILTATGHTYKKQGEKALFVVDNPIPVYGNLGSLCVDQDINRHGKEAFADEKPKVIRIDTTDVDDVHFGYGTYCGGAMEILLEPISSTHRQLYAELRGILERGEARYLLHDLTSGDLTLHITSPQPKEHQYIETIHAPTKLYIFGATPLARHIVRYVRDMDYEIHIIDWRDRYLAGFEAAKYVRRHEHVTTFDPGGFVLVMSHSHDRDMNALKQALADNCAYIGLLSSKKRRDHLYAELEKDGVARADLERVCSPIGIDIKGRSDPEIAVSIVAELVRCRNMVR